MKVSGLRASLALQDALRQVGLPRTSGYNGGETTGWLEMNRSGSTGFSLKPRKDGGLDWHLVISGKPHIRYREYTDTSRDETYHLHSPINPEVVYPLIRKAYEKLGVKVTSLQCRDWQEHWDDDVGYDVVTETPDWLEPYSPNNAPRASLPDPLLVAVCLTGEYFGGAGRLPAYRTAGGLHLTREGLDVIAGHKEWNGVSLQRVNFDPNGFLTIERNQPGKPARRTSAPRHTVRNFWGDDIEVWRMPATALRAMPVFRTDVPALISGRMATGLTFAEHDAQYGGDAPWLEAEAAPVPGI